MHCKADCSSSCYEGSRRYPRRLWPARL